MREEMERLYNRCVLSAPISDVMKVPYRAEIVWLVIRHALVWHDNPEGMPGCVSYYDPMNRSDQPQPKIELKLGTEKDGPAHDGKRAKHRRN